jgi:hypothetical protein
MGSFSIWHWLILAVLLYAGYRLFARSTSKPSRAAAARPPAPQVAQSAHHWPALGEFGFSIVGESNYQPALAAIAGDHGKKKARVECVAELRPDDDNPHDDKAVEVCVDGRTVGYLARDEARKFRRRLGQKGLTGQSTFCAALVVGGGEWRGEVRHYGVQLDLKPFDRF